MCITYYFRTKAPCTPEQPIRSDDCRLSGLFRARSEHHLSVSLSIDVSLGGISTTQAVAGLNLAVIQNGLFLNRHQVSGHQYV